MIKITGCALALAFTLALSGTAFATNMSKKDMMMMQKCQGMSQSMMMKNKKCVALMKKSKKNGSMGSNSMGSGSMNNGSAGNSSSGAGNMGGATSK